MGRNFSHGPVGSNTHYFNISGKLILLDPGSRIKFSKYRFPNFKAIVVTHAHADHVDGLADYANNCQKLSLKIPPIYMTAATKEFTLRYLGESNQAEVLRTISQNIHVTEFGKPFNIDGITCTFRSAGHIAGAAAVLFDSKEHVKVLYTGDFSRKDTTFNKGLEVPPENLKLLIIEGTNTGKKGERTQEENLAALLEKQIKNKPVIFVSRPIRPLIDLILGKYAQEVLPPYFPSKIYCDESSYSHFMKAIELCQDTSLAARFTDRLRSAIVPLSELNMEATPNPFIIIDRHYSYSRKENFISRLNALVSAHNLEQAAVVVGRDMDLTQIDIAKTNGKLAVSLDGHIVWSHGEGHATDAEIRDVIKNTKAENIIFVHGGNRLKKFVRELQAEYPSKKIFISMAGQPIDIE